jgi:hypothetical protein
MVRFGIRRAADALIRQKAGTCRAISGVDLETIRAEVPSTKDRIHLNAVSFPKLPMCSTWFGPPPAPVIAALLAAAAPYDLFVFGIEARALTFVCSGVGFANIHTDALGIYLCCC